ncbi:Fc.00g021300.m01.CDS01 [Cosmosporella sp. VM-42]
MASSIVSTVGSSIVTPKVAPKVTPVMPKVASAGNTMPPSFKARVGNLETFTLPSQVTSSRTNLSLGKAIIRALQRDGIFQVRMSAVQQRLYQAADAASRSFFQRPHAEKAVCVDGDSYSGYVASGEEITAGIADYSEIFTVTKDLDKGDKRVLEGWPCHGPCPWPDREMKNVVDQYMRSLAENGEKLLQLIELGLDVPEGSLTNLTEDGWHHMRILRFPPRNKTNGKGKKGRGIGSHTDYGLLVIAAQDDVGGLFITPPRLGEHHENWNESTAGLNENDSNWVYVPPVPGTFTVFPGDMLQYLTDSALPSTPHKVGLNTHERFAFAYFHEPNFRSVIKPLLGYNNGQEPQEGIHYGTHFTNMFLRNYPNRITTKKLLDSGRYAMLDSEELRDEEILTEELLTQAS